MASKTTNYNFQKDAKDDFYNIDTVNDNLDKIDGAIRKVQTEAENKNGGNADMVDGKHAADFAEKIHKHSKADVEGLTDLKLGNDGKATVSYAEYAWDSNKLNGKGYDNFVTSGVYHTNADLNNPSFNKAYIAVSNSAEVVPQTGGSDSGYWHIMFFPYSGTGGGSGTQIAMPFSGNKLYMRSADGGRWSEWTGFISDKGGTIYGSINMTDYIDDETDYNIMNLKLDSLSFESVDTLNNEGMSASYGLRKIVIRNDAYLTQTTITDDKVTTTTVEADYFVGDGSNVANVNADTVNGKHAEDFADNDHTHTSFNQLDYVSFRPDEYFGDYWVEINRHSIYGRNDSVETDQLPVIKDFSKISAEEFEGDGSNLTNVNADTVDGKHASAFALSSHAHSTANTNSAGFMSAADKVKLDGIAAGANKITVDSALSASSANPVQNKAVNAALSLKTDGYKKVLSFTASAGNWYRIINTANASRMCGGVFTLSGGVSNNWSNTVFSASQSYTTPKGANKIASITHSYFNGFISKLRLVNEYNGSNQYIDAYVGFGSNLNVSLTILFNGIGWEAVNSVKTANTVSGYTVHEITLPQED